MSVTSSIKSNFAAVVVALALSALNVGAAVGSAHAAGTPFVAATK